MNIFLPSNLRTAWEGTWIKFLLGDHFHAVQYYNDTNFPLADKSFFVTYYNNSYKQHLELMVRRQFTFGILLLSDEFLTDQCEYVDQPECKFVIRNYIHPNLYQNNKVAHIGLGFKKNFNKYVIKNDFSERDFMWNFIGSVHGSSRNEALNFFNRLQGGMVHKTKHFNSNDYLTTKQYCDVLCSSCYTLCPQGHANNETFRIFEALEAGSIPVVLKNSESHPFNPSYWHYLFPGEFDFPFLVADNWEQALYMVETDINIGSTASRQKLCQEFWIKWKATWRYQVHSKLALLG